MISRTELRQIRQVAVVVGLLVTLVFAADATATGRLERSTGFNSNVTAISQPDSNGTRYVGGNFTAANSWLSGIGAGFGVTSGEVTVRFPRIGAVNNSEATILSVISDGSGGVYIGGYFDCIGGDAGSDGDCTDAGEAVRRNLAHLKSDGSLDPSWNPEPNGTVYALARSNSTVYIGGGFTTVGGYAHTALAAIGTDGLPTTWNPVTAGVVRALAIQGSTVYAGGNFAYNGGPSKHVGAFDRDGLPTDWHPITNGDVKALAVVGSTVYVGGSFTLIDSQPRVGLAAVGTDGTISDWHEDIGPSGYSINTITVSGSTVYVGGNFETFGGQARAGLAQFQVGGAITDWNPGTNGTVATIVISGSTVFIGGSFTTLAGEARSAVGAVDARGRATSWAPIVFGTEVSVQSIALIGPYAYLGGTFDTAGGVPRNHLAAITKDGSLASWAPVADAAPSTLLVSGATVYVGGDQLTTVNGAEHRGVAAIGTDGTLSDWNPGLTTTGFGTYVASIIRVGGTLLIGGSFNTVGGTLRAGAAAIDTTGACATRYTAACLKSWNPGNDGYLQTMAPVGDVLVVGGVFNTFGGAFRDRLAAVSIASSCIESYSDAACLFAWAPQSGGANVWEISIIGSTAFVAGTFLDISAVPRSGLAALEISPACLATFVASSCVTSWNPVFPLYKSPRAVTPLGTTLYLGGRFTTLNGSARMGAAAVKGDSTCISDYTPACNTTWAPSVTGLVSAIATADAHVLLGGLFSAVNGQNRSNIAEVGTDGALLPALPKVVPTLTTVTPASGPVAGGTSITLTGTGLSNATVTVGGVAAEDVDGVDDATLVVVTPPGTAGPADVVITTAFGSATLVGGFTYGRASNHVRIHSNSIQIGHSRLSFVMSVPGPGTLNLQGYFVPGARTGRHACTNGKRTITTKGVYRLSCRFSSALRAARRSGPVRLHLSITYKPTGGVARITPFHLVLAATRAVGPGPAVTG